MTLGNGVKEQISWNDRSQPTKLEAKTAALSSLLTLDFYPCASSLTYCASGNNGNLQSQAIRFPALGRRLFRATPTTA